MGWFILGKQDPLRRQPVTRDQAMHRWCRGDNAGSGTVTETASGRIGAAKTAAKVQQVQLRTHERTDRQIEVRLSTSFGFDGRCA
jgi:hypothetical protein